MLIATIRRLPLQKASGYRRFIAETYDPARHFDWPLTGINGKPVELLERAQRQQADAAPQEDGKSI
jgi:hypothetical protein